MDYTTISLADVRSELEAIGAEADTVFGRLDARQLNWKPEASRWSVAQCLEHLVTANRQMADMADQALDPARRRTIWQRLPIWPGLLGRMLVRSQSPDTTRRFKAPGKAQPAASAIDAGIVGRFVDQQRTLIARLDAVATRDLASAVMASPFVGLVTYTVLDGWRLMVAHERRHVQQARRVMAAPGFPG
jgi:non-ribosomal peptide synthetase component F